MIGNWALFARAWLEWAWSASWQIALLVCLIGVLTWALRGTSARLRYGLWLLVLVKALLPPTLGTVWGVGNWGLAPVASLSWSAAEANRQEEAGVLNQPAVVEDESGLNRADGERTLGDNLSGVVTSAQSLAGVLLALWAAGCAVLWTMVAWKYGRLVKSVGAMRPIDEGPARVELERLAQRLHVQRVPELYATAERVSPMLFGVARPRIVLPESVLVRLDVRELQMILAHELVHWRRRDTWVGWLQVFVQGLLWFHPFVWLANARIRHERECACDEAVLRGAQCDRDGYGETLLRVLTAARGRSLVMANMVGVFERGSRLQTRLEEIMSFDPTKRKFGWLSRAAVVAAALVLLPMAAPGLRAEEDESAATADKGEATEAVESRPDSDRQEKERPRTNWPVVVKSSPAIGATDVDPNVDEISVTFDRDMNVGGYSWTGGGPFYPRGPAGSSAVWKDKRTCVLPVKLKRGSFYRVGINSSSFQNFKSALGVSAETTAIYFATKGASPSVASRVRVPKVAKSNPEIGATDVDPRLGLITVTFNMPMDTHGFSWTGGGPTFPTIPDGQRPRWSRDGKTCTLPVKLEPGKKYELGLNSVSHKNFTSKWGVPLAPVWFEFSTAGDAAEEGTTEAVTGKRPKIVKMVPENGTMNVDPSLTALRVTFDRPMAGGFSWTGGGPHFPTIPAGKKPRWSADRKTCTLPVSLKPGRDYRLGLNSVSFKNFASADGVPLEPVVYTFRTSP